jgi:hypothetical protein
VHVQASSVPASGAGALGDIGVPPGVFEAALRAALVVVQSQQPVAPSADERPDLPPLLKPEQVKELTGWSRNTVDRMIDEGDLPHICAREGARQRMRQVPKAFVLQMMADLKRGVSIPDMKAYAQQWQETIPGQPSMRRPLASGAPAYAAEVA